MKEHRYSLTHYVLMVLMRFNHLRTSEQGFIVFFVASIVVLLSFIWVAYGLLSRIDASSTSASVKSNTGFYASEYGLNVRAKEIRGTFEGFNQPSGTSPANWKACLNNAANQGSGDFICKNLTIQDQTISTYVVDKTQGVPIIDPVPPGEPFAGLTAQAYIYDVISVAQDRQGLPTASLKMTFRNLLIPLFQFAVFSENDADFSLPPNMTLNGPVHSNRGLYLNAAAGSQLTINGQITVVDALYRGLKYQNSCTGVVSINDKTNPVALPCDNGGARKTYDTQASVSTWNNRVLVPVQRLEVPQPDTLDPVPGRLYWDRADLRIALTVQNNPASVSGATPIAIQVRNADGSANAPLTNAIQACTPVLGTVSSQPDARTIQLSSAAALSTQRVNNAPLLIGTAFDSLVATGPDANTDGFVDNGTTVQLRKAQPLNSLSGSVRKAVLWSSDTFFNYREKDNGDGTGSYSLTGPNAGRYIRMLNVDVQGLMDCVQSQSLMGAKTLNDTTDGGLVWFFTVDGPNSSTNVTATPNAGPNNYGIRLYNGSSLQSTIGGAPAVRGLTVVSDQAIYIQGNYNSVNKIPAAVLTDSLNVLSQAWFLDDSDTGRFDPATGILDTVTSGATVIRTDQCVDATPVIGCNAPSPNRIAAATTINAAFLSGLDIPGGSNGTGSQDNGQASSGVHNYPRFHERWTGIALNYRGSMVALGVPRRIKSPFCGSSTTGPTCNIYAPPLRNWDYDTDFNNAANLPPLTPRAVYLKQDAFSRNFEVSFVDLNNRLPGFPSFVGFSSYFPRFLSALPY